jgi:hypothetical protein
MRQRSAWINQGFNRVSGSLLVALLIALSACKGGELEAPPVYEPPVVNPNMPPGPIGGEPMGGEPVAGEPVAGEPVAGEPVAGEPIAGVIEPPVGGEPPLCEPLTPESYTLFSQGEDESVAYAITGCGSCHFGANNSPYILPLDLAYANGVDDEAQIAQIYEGAAPYILPGDGAGSGIIGRMSDGHGGPAIAPDSPLVTAMIAWIDSMTPCD